VGITRHCTKHNYLVKSIEDLPRILHEAFYVAAERPPRPVVVDLPKDIQFKSGRLCRARLSTGTRPTARREGATWRRSAPRDRADGNGEAPGVLHGGGVINSGPHASALLRELVRLTGFPITSTLMGLGAFPAPTGSSSACSACTEPTRRTTPCTTAISDRRRARFDDRITGRPRRLLAALQEDPDRHRCLLDQQERQGRPRHPGDCAHVLEDMVAPVAHDRPADRQGGAQGLVGRDRELAGKDCLRYRPSDEVIKPQYAVQRLYELTKNRETYVTTEVGQHQMWAAQFYKFEEPNRWMTSGRPGTMGYGLPAAIGVQLAHPKGAGGRHRRRGLDPDEHAGDVDRRAVPAAGQDLHPNNEYMGMVRQWQELLHGGRYSESYSESLPIS
jgi:acetolactate synthase-1/2/3 large subunit